MPPSDEHPFGLDDAAFWEEGWRFDADLQGQVSGERALRIDAPRQVDLAARTTLPVGVLHGDRLATLEVASVELRAVVVAVRRADGALFCGRAADPPPPGLGGPPGAPPSPGWGASTHAVDLRERLRLPWEPAEVLVTVLLNDLVSNRVRVRLGDPARALLPPEGPAAPSPPGDPLPSFEARPDSPAPPAEGGVALAAERVTALTPDRPTVLRGAFRVPPRRHEVAAPEAAGPRCVVPVGLVLTSAGGLLRAVRLQVPAALGADGQAEGRFAVDLHACGVPRAGDTVFAWAFVGDAMAGPTWVGLVSPEQLQGE